MFDIEKYNRRLQWGQRPYGRKREYLWKRHGINFTWSQFLAMLERESYKCAICSCGIDETTAHLDHNHANEQVRGLLCGNCNLLLGKAHDSVDILQAAIPYLSSNVR